MWIWQVFWSLICNQLIMDVLLAQHFDVIRMAMCFLFVGFCGTFCVIGLHYRIEWTEWNELKWSNMNVLYGFVYKSNTLSRLLKIGLSSLYQYIILHGQHIGNDMRVLPEKCLFTEHPSMRFLILCNTFDANLGDLCYIKEVAELDHVDVQENHSPSVLCTVTCQYNAR